GGKTLNLNSRLKVMSTAMFRQDGRVQARRNPAATPSVSGLFRHNTFAWTDSRVKPPVVTICIVHDVIVCYVFLMPSSANDLRLEEQACFALYAASRAVTDVYRPLLA